nr:synapse differentiation-inducing gene protein 1-like [Pogona vitticeps]
MPSSQGSVPSYLGLSIFTMLCCCLPLGIAAVIYSSQVDNANCSGDFNRASQASRTARKLNIIGIVLGVITLIIVAVIYAVVFTQMK